MICFHELAYIDSIFVNFDQLHLISYAQSALNQTFIS